MNMLCYNLEIEIQSCICDDLVGFNIWAGARH